MAFPNLYADIKGIPWLYGGTAWAGTRYYKRESIYISDFFYWNPSGVGGGIEDINLGSDLRLSYAAVRRRRSAERSSLPQLPAQIDFGIRNDLQLRGIKPYQSGEIQVGLQYIADFSDDKDANGTVTHGGWGVTVQTRAGVARRRQQAGFPVRQGRGHRLRNACAILLPRLLAPLGPQVSHDCGSSMC